MSKDDETVASRSVEGQDTLSVSKDIPTLAADFVKVFVSPDVETCTFVFFRRHPRLKLKSDGVGVEGTDIEAFLEIKVPLNSAFALGIYLKELDTLLQKDPTLKHKGHWGPLFTK